ncbi:MAG: ADP-dependent (S)-NAD(P)H-hydrate dehydratase [Actinobacteria bacterium]|nr:ADP-dependent (S)-NAD(P)H-hydrate dehydratase [Actinomycetota bacterium]
MLAIVGTIPDKDFPLVTGELRLEDENVFIEGNKIDINRGTPALIASAVKVLEVLKLPLPFGYLAGDIGLGDGSKRLYTYLAENLKNVNFKAIVFHYLLPEVDGFNRVMFALECLPYSPILVADAGGMYVAKMSGQAQRFDLFTPDAGEIAFIADEEAPHPFYTRGFILQEENRVPDLIKRAYAYENASRYLMVKGNKDYVADKNGIIADIDYPMVEALEPIGGTGDTLTGIVSALIASGMAIDRAAIAAAQINRLAGYYANPTPATQVFEIIEHIPRALIEVISSEKALNFREVLL